MTNDQNAYALLAQELGTLRVFSNRERYLEVSSQLEKLWSRLTIAQQQEVDGFLICLDEVERTGRGYPPSVDADDPHDDDCRCTTCQPEHWQTWTAEREAEMMAAFANYGVQEGEVCKQCNLAIVFDRDPSFHSQRENAKVCSRTNPFCLNHAHKVDWRNRCLAAEAVLRQAIDKLNPQYCPACGDEGWSGEHRPECALARALEQIRE